jgi:hypothetical protein
MEQTNTTTRPTFLTVLCILTWIGSGIGLIGGILGLVGQSAVQGMDLGAEFNKQMENTQMLNYASLACIVICVIGSTMMWQMKKTGYYIYLIGELAPLLLSFAMIGSISQSTGVGGGILAASGVIGSIFPIAFVIMYGLNLKHMK